MLVRALLEGWAINWTAGGGDSIGTGVDSVDSRLLEHVRTGVDLLGLIDIGCRSTRASEV